MAKRKAKRVKTGEARTGEEGPEMADYRALSDFRYALRRFLAFSGDAARGVGLTPQQHQALLAILGHAGETPMTVGALAERLLLKHHSTVELVDRLGELDLVRRATATDDRRKVTLRLTDKARKLMTSLSSAHLEELRRIRPVFAALIDRLDV
jgi:DNA-binding MarR family transcriptional regulator